jgi:hypothetical protein
MTHHHGAPARAADLRPGDTVAMNSTTNLETGSSNTRTPCCKRQVRISGTDVGYMARRPSYTVTRYCGGCGWPYYVRVEALGALSATFTVCQPPKGA